VEVISQNALAICSFATAMSTVTTAMMRRKKPANVSTVTDAAEAVWPTV